MPLALIDGVRAAAVTSGTAGVTTQDFTVSGVSWTPIAALIEVTYATSANTSTNEASLSVGVTDGTFEGGLATVDQHNVSTTVTRRAGFDDAVIRVPTPGASTSWEAVGSFDSFISGGIRILWDTIPTAAFLVHVTLWFGDGTTVSAGSVTPPSKVSSPSQVTTGNQPNHIIVISPTAALNESFGNVSDLQIAHVVRTTGTTAISRFMSAQQQNNKATSESTLVVLSQPKVALSYRSGVSIPVGSSSTTIPSFHATDGFNVGSDGDEDTDTGPLLVYLAFEYEENEVDLQDFQMPTSISTVTHQSGFRSGAAFSLTTAFNNSTWNSNNFDGNAGYQSLGFIGQSETQWAVGQGHQDGASTTNTESRSEDNFIFVMGNTAATVVHEGNASFHATNGLTISYSAAPAAGRLCALLQVSLDVHTGTGADSFPLFVGTGSGNHILQGTSGAEAATAATSISAQRIVQAAVVASASAATVTIDAGAIKQAGVALQADLATVVIDAQPVHQTSVALEADAATAATDTDVASIGVVAAAAASASVVFDADKISQTDASVSGGAAVVSIDADKVVQTTMALEAAAATVAIDTGSITQAGVTVTAGAATTANDADKISQTSVAAEADPATATVTGEPLLVATVTADASVASVLFDADKISQTSVTIAASDATTAIDGIVGNIVTGVVVAAAATATTTIPTQLIHLTATAAQAGAATVSIDADKVAQTSVTMAAGAAEVSIGTSSVTNTTAAVAAGAASALFDADKISQTSVALEAASASVSLDASAIVQSAVAGVAGVAQASLGAQIVHQTSVATQAATAIVTIDGSTIQVEGSATVQADPATVSILGQRVVQTTTAMQAGAAVTVFSMGLGLGINAAVQAEADLATTQIVGQKVIQGAVTAVCAPATASIAGALNIEASLALQASPATATISAQKIIQTVVTVQASPARARIQEEFGLTTQARPFVVFEQPKTYTVVASVKEHEVFEALKGHAVIAVPKIHDVFVPDALPLVLNIGIAVQAGSATVQIIGVVT